MNKLYCLFVAMVFFSFFSCNNDNRENDVDTLIDYNGKTHLEFIVSNCSDTTVFQIQSRTVIPLGLENKQLIVPDDGTYKITLNSTHPFLGQLFLQNRRFPLFTIPNDTLKIYIDLDLKNSIKYEGKTEQINDYFLEKFKRFDYPDIAVPATNYTSPSFSIYEGAAKIDSLFNEEIKFFSAYENRSDLPDWFIEMEKLNLIYYKAGFKIAAISSRNHFNGEDTKADDSYFNFLDSIPVNNPKALLSSHYFEFLESYYYLQDMDKYDDSKTGFERAYPILKMILPNILSGLSGDIRKYCLAFEFSRFYLNTDKVTQVLKLDSLLETVSYYIGDSTLINTLKNNSHSKIETFEELSFLSKGEKAPDFYLSDVNGKFHALHDFKGKLIYLSFWATWCSPCIKTLPQKNALIREYENKSIVFINISFDRDKDKWEKFIEDHPVSGLNLICKGNWEDVIKTNYYIQGIPKYVLISKVGEIIDSDAPSPGNKSELAGLIDKYLD